MIDKNYHFLILKFCVNFPNTAILAILKSAMKKTKSIEERIALSEIGDQIKFARIMKNLTQQDLALRLNVTHQQVARYEKGENSVSFDKLQSLSHALDIPITQLIKTSEPIDEHPFFSKALKPSGSQIPESEIIDLIDAYTKIKNADARKTVLAMIKLIKKQNTKAE